MLIEASWLDASSHKHFHWSKSGIHFQILTTKHQLCKYLNDSDWLLGKSSSLESDQVPEQAAHGGGGVTVPEGVQETFTCCTERHGLVWNIGNRWTVGLDKLRGLYQPWWFCGSLNKTGSSTRPWGTPVVTGLQLDSWHWSQAYELCLSDSSQSTPLTTHLSQTYRDVVGYGVKCFCWSQVQNIHWSPSHLPSHWWRHRKRHYWSSMISPWWIYIDYPW